MHTIWRGRCGTRRQSRSSGWWERTRCGVIHRPAKVSLLWLCIRSPPGTQAQWPTHRAPYVVRDPLHSMFSRWPRGSRAHGRHVISLPDDPRDLTYDRQVARQFGRFVSGWWRGATARRAWFLTHRARRAGHRQHRLEPRGQPVEPHLLRRARAPRQLDAWLGGPAFAGLVVVIAGIGVLIVITRETLQVRWREWLVHRLTGLWLGRQRYYRLNLAADRAGRIPSTASPTRAALGDRAAGRFRDRIS